MAEPAVEVRKIPEIKIQLPEGNDDDDDDDDDEAEKKPIFQ